MIVTRTGRRREIYFENSRHCGDLDRVFRNEKVKKLREPTTSTGASFWQPVRNKRRSLLNDFLLPASYQYSCQGNSIAPRRRRKEGKSAFKTIRGDSVCLEERTRCIFGIGFTKFDRSQQRSIRNLSKQ